MKENSLLAPIRQLRGVFLESEHEDSALEEGAREIAGLTGSAALVLDKDGGVLASDPGKAKIDESLKRLIEEGSIAGDYGLMALVKTGEPLFNETYPVDRASEKTGQAATAEKSAQYTVIPIQSSGKSIGALLLYKPGRSFNQNQLILAEVGATLLGMVLMRETADQEEKEARDRKLAEEAFESLSYSEVEAIHEMLKTIKNKESIVVASKIADGLGITRSVIVNALRKFESAGIIESRSLGMKGTLIRVKNLHALEMIASRSAKMTSM